IDLHAQYFAYRELERAYKEFSAGDQTPKSASLVALDVETGEVIAMASYPSFNPNDRRNLKPQYTRNRPVVDLYEPGSTVKAFTISAGLESGKFTPETPIDASSRRVMIQGHWVEDVHNYGQIDVTRVITKSSNVGASQIALAVGAERMLSMFHRVGFGDMSNIQFPGEPVGRMLDVNDKKQFELATLSFGYGLSVSSLQLAQAYAVIAAGGVKRQVTFEKQNGFVPGEQVIDPKIARQVTSMLETVVSAEGTAIKAKVPGYRVAGKTGTVHKTAASGGYEADEYRSVFCGFAPVSHPKIAMVVMIDDPKTGAYYGGVVAAPVFSRVMSNLLRVMNVPPDDVQDPSKSLVVLNPQKTNRL
ncbi:MAG TPA: penicillin-binding protein 2, partial [Pseudomonadales bacterium]|nr:penicillin-binding protein 2 [Pseudomonadales bacterium]